MWFTTCNFTLKKRINYLQDCPPTSVNERTKHLTESTNFLLCLTHLEVVPPCQRHLFPSQTHQTEKQTLDLDAF